MTFKKMLVSLAMIAICAGLMAGLVQAQSNAPPSLSIGPLGLLESYVVDNDPTYNGFLSNHFVLWQAASFASVNGTPGASAIGNDLGLEVPVYNHVLCLDSTTRFEQLFGDVHHQQFGLQYAYNLNQIQLSAGLDARYVFTGSRVQAVPYIEFKKASTSLRGIGTFLRYSFPIHNKPGAGEVDVGLFLPL